MPFRNLQPIVVNCEGAAHLLGTTEQAFRKMLQRGIGPRSFSFYKNDVRFHVREIEEWSLREAGLLLPEPTPPTTPKRGPGRPRGSTKKKD